MQIDKKDIFNAKVLRNKVLIKLTKSKGYQYYKNSSIIVPLSNTELNEGIVLAIPLNDKFHNLNTDKEELINVKKGDIVILSFVSYFSSFIVDGEKYVVVPPSVIIAKCQKDKYYKDL